MKTKHPLLTKKNSKPTVHRLDMGAIEELDEINGIYQLCWVWCETCKRLEWHSLTEAEMKNYYFAERTSDPVDW